MEKGSVSAEIAAKMEQTYGETYDSQDLKTEMAQLIYEDFNKPTFDLDGANFKTCKQFYEKFTCSKGKYTKLKPDTLLYWIINFMRCTNTEINNLGRLEKVVVAPIKNCLKKMVEN